MDRTVKTRVIASSRNWMESSAIEQLERTAALPGMMQAVGMPDLHPGKGSPVGAAFISRGIVYPYLIGGDIGCGMAFWKTNLAKRKMNLDKWEKKLTGLGEISGEAAAPVRELFGAEPTEFDRSLGTIGKGNHFAEFQVIDRIVDSDRAEKTGLDPDSVYLLVHSGSRGYGTSILREHTDRFADAGLATDSAEFQEYLTKHNNAIRWARANRRLIAELFLECLSASGQEILDIFHNYLEETEQNQERCWIHRKGAAPADRGPVIVPGSRGAHSYLVDPSAGSLESGFSLAHGAGRKWDRSSAKHRIRERYKKKELTRTALGSRVICTDKDLLYEEAPEAYKNIDTVVGDLVDSGLASVIAILKPVITFKTNEQGWED